MSTVTGINAALSAQITAAPASGTPAKAVTASAAGPSPRLVNAAHEFEAQMMKELLEPMTRPDALTGDSEDGEGSNGALGQFASEALGRAISDRGGFGIATSILHQLSRKPAPAPSGSLRALVFPAVVAPVAPAPATKNSHPGNDSQSMQVTGSRHNNTVMKPSQ